MAQREVIMKTVTREEAQQQIDQLIDQIAEGKTRTLIVEDGQAVAVLISVEELKRLQRYEDFRILEEFGSAFADQTSEQIERESVKALRQARTEKQAQTHRSTQP